MRDASLSYLSVWSPIVIAQSVSILEAKVASFVPVAASLSMGVRTALLALLGLLVVILGCLIAFAFVIRRRPAGVLPEQPADRHVPTPPRRAAAPPMADSMVCPACRREFDPGLRHCPHDAAHLVPASELLERLHGKHHRASICPRCRRAYEGRVRFCPHDGSDLVPAGVFQARSSSDHDHDDDLGAKICPECQGRYGFAASFCGKDGVELVVLN